MIDAFQVLLHCNRVAKRSDDGVKILREIIAEDFEELVYPSIRVAIAEGGPIAGVLEELLRESPAPISCMTLANAIPPKTVVLASFATVVLEQKLRLEVTMFDRDFTDVILLPGVPRFPSEMTSGVHFVTPESESTAQEQAMVVAKEYLLGIARTLVEFGRHTRTLNDLPTALAAFQRAEELASRVFNASPNECREFYFEIALSLAWTFLDMGNIEEARSWAIRVFNLHGDEKDRSLEDVRIVAETGLLVSKTLTDDGEISTALHLAEASVRDFASLSGSETHESEPMMGLASANFAKILQRAGRLSDAVATVDALSHDLKGMVVLSSDAFTPLHCRVLIISAEIFLLAGQVSRALESAEQAAALADKLHQVAPRSFSGMLCRALSQKAQTVLILKGAAQAIEILEDALSIGNQLATAIPEVRHASACALLLRSQCWLQARHFDRALEDAQRARGELLAVATLYPFFNLKLKLIALVFEAEALEGLGNFGEALGFLATVEAERENLKWSFPAEHTLFIARSMEVKARLLFQLGEIQQAGTCSIYASAQCSLWQGEKPATFAAQQASCLVTLARASLAAGDAQVAAQSQNDADTIYRDYEQRGLKVVPAPLLLELSQ